MKAFRDLAGAIAWLRDAPPGTQLDAHALAEALEALPAPDEQEPERPAEPMPWTWRERLWLVPSETRLGVEELAEAIGVSRSWVYRRTQTSAEDPLPHRKLDGALVFAAGEIRAWLRTREDVIAAGPFEAAAWEREGVLRAV